MSARAYVGALGPAGVAGVLELVDAKIEAAAVDLVPVLTGTTTDPAEIRRAVHDALNHLAAARLRAGLALQDLEVTS